MKKCILFIVITLITMICHHPIQAATFGPNATSGTWTYNVINDGLHYHLCQVKPNNTMTIELTGDVTVDDRIFVGSATYIHTEGYVHPSTTLHIKNGSGKPVTIKYNLSTEPIKHNGVVVQSNPSGVFFSVFINAKLIIEGTESAPIIIDGNWDSKTVPYGFIENQGTIDFKHVILQNVKLSSNRGDTSLFKLSPFGKKTYYTGTSGDFYYKGYQLGTTTLDHCTIRNISSGSYGAVMLAGFKMSEVAANTRTSNKISITNCEIYNVNQTGVATTKTAQGENVDYASGTAGLFRFRGAWVGDFYMKNTKIHDNTSVGIGGGVFWNAIGRASDRPVFTIDGCEFYNNTVTDVTVSGTKVEGSAPAMVLQGQFKFEGNTTKVYNNTSNYLGGGIYVMGYTGMDATGRVDVTMNINDKLEMYGNSAELGGGMVIDCPEQCSMDAGSTVTVNINGCNIHNNKAIRMGGGMHIQWYSEVAKARPLTVNLNQGNFTENVVTGTTAGNYGGGGLSILGGTVKSSSGARCYFTSNKSGYQGGAIRFDEGANVQLGTVDITNCTAAYGGGITVEGSGTTASMSDVKISGCSATGTGGGISLYDKASATINSADISSCKASAGGAISAFGGSNLTINQATISGNEVTYAEGIADSGCGGAILTDASMLTINDGTISNNTARDGGGVYLKLSSTFGMTKGVISDNVATRRGGGIYSSGVGFALKEGLITRNSAGDFGGGIFYNNGSSSNTADHTIAGGTVSYNKAYAGGGIYCNAFRKSKLYIKNTLMEYNEALLGGGLFSYFTDLTLTNAYVRYNKAIGGASGNPGSMYSYIHCSGGTAELDAPKSYDLGGIGGGIYTAFKSHLTFDTKGGFGIYANLADYGADDIYAQGGEGSGLDYSDQSITLPAIAELGLSGYNVPVSQGNLFWAEDYIVNDTNYGKGSNKLGENGKNLRYRTSVEQMKLDLVKTAVASGKYTNKYLMLAVGYGVGKATLRKKGLKQGETCVFKVYSQDTKQNQYHQSTGVGDRPVNPLNCYMTIMMVGGGTEVDEKTLILPTGNWVVQESPYWAWTYNKVDDTNPPVNTLEDPLLIGKAVTATGDPAVFEFTNTKRTDIVVPHDEEVRQNSLQKQ